MALVPLIVIAFLYASDFTDAWDGHAVSVKPAERADPTHYSVLVVSEDRRERWELLWPAALVEPMGLPVDRFAITPDTNPERAVETRKSRFALHFMFRMPNESWQTIQTITPSSLGVAFLVLIVAIAVRNMIVAGSPFSIEPEGLALPKGQAPSGQAVAPRGSRPRKGPPPGRRRKGVGRR